MPGLDTDLHLRMYARWKRRRKPLRRLLRVLGFDRSGNMPPIYGLQWGDPETSLRPQLERFLLPYVNSEHTAIEIGVGGGVWTRYLLGFKKLYAVDFHQELLDELRKSVTQPNVTFVKNDGNDFPGVDDSSVDFLFSWGTFVHLELDLIDQYLVEMRRVLKPTANVCLQYSDHTKPLARKTPGLSKNSPAEMRALVEKHGFTIADEDTTSMESHAAMRFTP